LCYTLVVSKDILNFERNQMSINFDNLLTDEQKRQILEQRIQQFAVEAYQITLNTRLAEASGDEEGKTNGDATLVTLESAINLYTEELDKLSPAGDVS
jgi:hypothetical protein